MRKSVVLSLVGSAVGTAVAVGWQRHKARNAKLPCADRNGRTALITGASSGIGAEYARQLAERGYNLVLVARREAQLTALAEELRAANRIETEVLAADLSLHQDVDRVAERIQNLPDLALLVNNAGFGSTGKFATKDPQSQVDMAEVHVVATARLTRAALPGMIARGCGGIINVSSVAAYLPGNAMYASTKAWMITFSNALTRELAGTGVSVQALLPGYTYTEFHDQPEFRNFKRSSVPSIFWLSADDLVSESLQCLAQGSGICVPGTIYNLGFKVLKDILPPLVYDLPMQMISHWRSGLARQAHHAAEAKPAE
ncbi:MAG: SDR family oxidoreductase [Anaerolineae bacterium]